MSFEGQNDHRFDDFMSEVAVFGADAGKGMDALPALAVRVVQAAADGVISLDPDTHGPGVDDAAHIYNHYIGAFSSKVTHAHTGTKQNASKVRQFIYLGLHPGGFGVNVIQRAVTILAGLVAAGEKTKSPYPAYADVARRQKKLDVELSDEELKEIMRKPAPEEVTLIDEVRAIKERIAGLISGENAHGLKCQHPCLIDAHDQILQTIDALTREHEMAEAA